MIPLTPMTIEYQSHGPIPYIFAKHWNTPCSGSSLNMHAQATNPAINWPIWPLSPSLGSLGCTHGYVSHFFHIVLHDLWEFNLWMYPYPLVTVMYAIYVALSWGILWRVRYNLVVVGKLLCSALWCYICMHLYPSRSRKYLFSSSITDRVSREACTVYNRKQGSCVRLSKLKSEAKVPMTRQGCCHPPNVGDPWLVRWYQALLTMQA